MSFKQSKKQTPKTSHDNPALTLSVGRHKFSVKPGKPVSASKWNRAQKKQFYCVDCGAACIIEEDKYFVCSRNPSHPRYFVSLIKDQGQINPKMFVVE